MSAVPRLRVFAKKSFARSVNLFASFRLLSDPTAVDEDRLPGYVGCLI